MQRRWSLVAVAVATLGLLMFSGNITSFPSSRITLGVGTECRTFDTLLPLQGYGLQLGLLSDANGNTFPGVHGTISVDSAKGVLLSLQKGTVWFVVATPDTLPTLEAFATHRRLYFGTVASFSSLSAREHCYRMAPTPPPPTPTQQQTPAPPLPKPAVDGPASKVVGNYRDPRTGAHIFIEQTGATTVMMHAPYRWSPSEATVNGNRMTASNPYIISWRGTVDRDGIHWAGEGVYWNRLDNERTARPQLDDIPDEVFPEVVRREGVTDDELRGIRAFAQAVNPGSCTREETNAEWERVLHALPPSLRTLWLRKGRTTFRASDKWIKVPCNTSGWVDPAGRFRAVPFWDHCCNKGPAIMQCEGEILDPNKCEATASLQDRCTGSALPLCSPYMEYLKQIDKPVVYGFGIGGEWHFEDFMAERGYEVHGFDPTTNLKAQHESHKKPGVTFHYRGLRGESKDIHRPSGYGFVGGPLYTLRQTMKDLGHKEIHLLRLDCDGCEWEAFEDFARNGGEDIKKVKLLIFEIHLSPELGMRDVYHARLLGRFWNTAMQLGFRLYYYHDNPCPNVHSFLRKNGVDARVCAHELAFYREKVP